MFAPSRQSGFTLIELMIVVFIIGLGASAAFLAVAPDRRNLLQEQTEHFVTAARFVADEAPLTYEIIGLFVEPGQSMQGNRWCYRWRRWRDSSWQPVSTFLPDQCLDADTDIEMIIEGEVYEYDERDTTPRPALWFYPSGETTPLEIAFFNRFDSNEIERVSVDMMGEIIWQEQSDDLEVRW